VPPAIDLPDQLRRSAAARFDDCVTTGSTMSHTDIELQPLTPSLWVVHSAGKRLGMFRSRLDAQAFARKLGAERFAEDDTRLRVRVEGVTAVESDAMDEESPAKTARR
jgi:hypothetical protein